MVLVRGSDADSPPGRLSGAESRGRPSQELVSDAEEKFHASLSVVDNALAGRDYLPGTDFTAADIMMGYAVGLLERVMGDGYPNATAYLNRLTFRPAYRRLAELEA